MKWLVFHIVSGHAFFTGIALIIGAVVVSTRSRPIFNRIAVLSFLVGIVAIVISSTAIPYWYYAIATVATMAWIVSHYLLTSAQSNNFAASDSLVRKPWRRWAPFGVCGVWLIAALLELPYHIRPSLVPTSPRSITVIGDSLTAGVGGSETSDTWPSILAGEHQLHVQDLSHVGETAASALKRAMTHKIQSPVVLVEIGGNDLLGSTTSAQFACDLDSLLGHLAAPNRQVIMFELPLPPFCHEYRRVQRSLAAKHHVALVPKRVLLSVLADRGATPDTIHLTQTGHQRMADCVWRLIQSAFGR